MRSVEEIDQEIRHYSALVFKRDKKILTLTITLSLAGLVTILVFGKGAVFLSVVGLCILSTYIVITSRTFHKQNGVYCLHCSCTLAPNVDVHNAIDSCLAGRENKVLCPKCNKAVAVRA